MSPNKQEVCLHFQNQPRSSQRGWNPATQPPSQPPKAPVVSDDDNIKIIKVSTSKGDLRKSPLSSLGIWRDGVVGSGGPLRCDVRITRWLDWVRSSLSAFELVTSLRVYKENIWCTVFKYICVHNIISYILKTCLWI